MPFRTPNTFLTVSLGLLLCVLPGCSIGDSTPSINRIADLPALPEGPKKQFLPRSIESNIRNVTLAIVGEVRGELEPCGCPTLPFGGFERRATQLSKLKTDSNGPVFHIDAGDTLVKGFATKRIDKIETRAKEMMHLSKMVGVDLWVPGPSDLLAMSPSEIARSDGPLRISATWVKSNGETLLSPTAILEKSGVRIGVIGLSGKPSNDALIAYRSPLDAIQKALNSFPDNLDWVIAVSNLSEGETAEIARTVTGISAIVSTRGKRYDTPALTTSGIPIIETPDRGRYLQVVHARLGSSPSVPMLLYPDPPTWRARMSALRRGKDDQLLEEGRGRNLGLINTIPLSADLDKPGTISDRLVKYKANSRKEATKNASNIEPNEPSYASSSACVNCHSSEFARWALTDHAQAWLSLVKRKETNNPDCVGCHTTAYGEPGGLGELSASNIRKFKGVQCEMCHGPLSGHPSDSTVNAHPVREEDCVVCHDEANSPDFDFPTYLAQASCQGGAPSIIPTPPDP